MKCFLVVPWVVNFFEISSASKGLNYIIHDPMFIAYCNINGNGKVGQKLKAV